MPTEALDGRTCYEMLYDVKPDLANLRVFGAACAIVGPSEKLEQHAWTVGWTTSISGAHVMYVQCTSWRWSGQAGQLWAGSSNFKHINYSMSRYIILYSP